MREANANLPVPFNWPPETGGELKLVADAMRRHAISGGGYYTRSCEAWFEDKLHAKRALLTHSCTAALEMAAMLADLEPGDEVIMPSYTFVSTANAVVLRRAVPVFVDIRPDTLNLDESLLEAAVTRRTKAIFVVHYAGVCVEMDAVRDVAARHGLLVVEDAAHALMATYRGELAGTLGDLACLSFHETKNIVSGEGGALLVNRAEYVARAEVLRDKGTNRARFLQGQVDKYSWVDIGSSYVPSELVAAFLRAQLDAVEQITADRVATWNRYHKAFAGIETRGGVRRPSVPPHCCHNGHIYYLLLPTREIRDRLIKDLTKDGINAIFHYVPLHSSEAGRRHGRAGGSMAVTEDLSGRLIRLPLWYGMAELRERVVECTSRYLDRLAAAGA